MKRIKIGNFIAVALIDKNLTAWYLHTDKMVASLPHGYYEIAEDVVSDLKNPPKYSDYLDDINKTLESISMLKPKKITMEF